MTPERVWALVDETGADWLRAYDLLLDAIQVPVLLLNIATQWPIEREDRRVVPASLGSLFGPFPQLVTRDMIATVARRCTTYVECVTDAGLPQPLRDRFTGEVLRMNRYYASPEMHEEAAQRLVAAAPKG
jgi:hypothetical protein